MRYHLYVFGILSLLLVAQTAMAAGTGLTYHGRILKPDGSPLESSAVQFTLEIRSPGSEACLLYQETQTINMGDSAGTFSLELGANPTFRASSTVDGGLSLSKIFGNKGTLTVPNCNFGTSYTPNVADGRILYITFNDGSGAQSLSAQKITFVPFAIEAMQLNGYTASQFLRVDSGVAPSLTAANLTTLNDLFNGTLNINTTGTVSSTGAVSGSEMRTSAIKVYNGSNYVQLTAPTLTGNVLFKLPAADGSSGQVLQTDGTGNLSWATPSVGGGGTITAVNVTAPLTNTGTATVPNIGIPMAGGTQSGYLSTADWNTFNNKLNSSDITSSLITTTLGYVPMNKAGDTMSGDLSTQNITMAANKYLTLSSNSTPGTSAGQVWYDSGAIKYFDGSSVKSLSTATGGITSFNGQTGASQTLTVSPTGSDFAINSSSNVTTLVVPSASASARGLLTSTDWTLFNSKQSNTLASGQIWVGNASGGAQAASLAGDINSVSNTGSVVVNKTTTGQSNTILSLDGSGVGTMKGLALNNTGTVTLAAQTASATYSLALPAAAPTGNQTLKVDAFGNLTWVSSTSLTDAFVKGGNSFGADTLIGLNDNYNLNIATNGTPRMTVLANGNVGIGTTNPNSPLQVQGNIAAVASDSSTTISVTNDNQTSATNNNPKVSVTNFMGSSTGYPQIALTNYGGSGASPSAATAGTILGNISVAGANGSGYNVNSSAQINFTAFSTFSATNAATDISFMTAPSNSTSTATVMTISHTGGVGIGTTNPSVSLDLGSRKDAIRLPAGTTAEQPSSPADGMLRYNTTNSNLEYSSGGTWSAVGSGSGSFSNITGPGAINITAGGTNQNITLTSSGTGVVTSPSIVTVTNTTASTSYNNGALVVSGGVGVNGAINTNSNITAAGSITSAASNIYKANGDAILSIESENTSTTTARYPRIDFANFLGNPASGAGGNPGINLINYRGTSSTTAAMKAGESLGSVIFGGSYNSGGGYYESASIWAVTTENFSSSTGGTSLQFLITPNGTKVSKSKMTLDQSGYLGLNTNTPTDPLHIVQADSSLGIRLENQSSTASRSPGITIKNYSGTFSGGPTLLFESARGSSSSTSTIKSGDNLGQILFQGLKNGTNYVPGAQIYSQASEDWAAGTAGTNLIFSTIVSGTNSGSERMRIDGATGRLGIGSSSPNNTLQVGSTGSSTTKQGVYVGTYLSTAGSAQYNGNWTSSGYWGLGPATNASDSTILLGNTNDPQGTWSGTQTLNLAVGGKVGVGTLAPIAPLDARGSRSFEASMVTMNTATDGYSGLGLYDSTGANKGLIAYGNSGAASAASSLIVTTRDTTSPIVFGINANEVARISTAGNLGIGTTTPTYPLSVYRSGGSSTENIESGANGTAAYSRYAGKLDAGTAQVWGAGLNQNSGSGNYEIYDYTANALRMAISPSGNVGIGKTPGYKLDVNGITGATNFRAGNGTYSAPSISFDNYPGVGIWSNGNLNFSNSGLQMTLNSNSLAFNAGGAGPQIYQTGGNAAKPSYAFNVDSDTGMYNPNASGGSKQLGFSTAGLERLRIDNIGNIGIGTTSPGYPLDVTYASAPNDSITNITRFTGGTDATLQGLGIAFWVNPSATANNRFAGIGVGDNVGARPLILGMNSNLAQGFVGIGTTTPGYLLDVNGATANVSGAWVVRSDQRLKRDIATLENPLDTVIKLRGVSFHWKDQAMDQQYGIQRGFIAQEMEQVVPEWVHEGKDGYKRIEKTGIEAYFVEAIKELYNKWFTDHTRIAELEKQNRELKEALCEMNPNSKICTK